MSEESFIQAARNTLAEMMRNDPSVVVLGEDVSSGGPFGLTKNLFEEFGAQRVRNTPISELSFVGVGIGMALGGSKPVIDLMFDDFLTLASDQLFNQAAKIHFMSGGRYSVPLVLWTVAGAGSRWGAQHSQHLVGWLMQVPGLKVVAPSTPAMARISLCAAIDDPDPVVIIVDRAVLYRKGELPGDNGSPFLSRVVRSGEQLSLVASGRLLFEALEVVDELGLSIEVIDLQRLSPLDVGIICDSVHKTGKLLIVHEEVEIGGLSALIAKGVYDREYWSLDAPIVSVNAPSTPVPAAPTLEDAYLVSKQKIRNAILATISA